MATVAALHTPSHAFLSAFLPIARAQLFPAAATSPSRSPIAKRIPLLPSLDLPVPVSVAVPIPKLLQDLWDGLLRAVPKKKTSHMKKRHRQMAGKALKDVTALNVCSSCGRPKRAHVLCPYCVMSIKRWISNGFRTPKQDWERTKEQYKVYNEERRILGLKPLALPKPPKGVVDDVDGESSEFDAETTPELDSDLERGFERTKKNDGAAEKVQ